MQACRGARLPVVKTPGGYVGQAALGRTPKTSANLLFLMQGQKVCITAGSRE
jgi:hypothetical protein